MPSLKIDTVGTFLALGGTFPAHREQTAEPGWPPNLWSIPDPTVVPEGEPVEIPPNVEDVVIGPEPVAVIGAPIERGTVREAAEAIDGFTVSNDLAALGDFPGYPYPDQESHSGRGFKMFPTFQPTLEEYVSLDAADLSGRSIEARIDGRVVVDGATDDKGWSAAEIVAHVSDIVPLEPGDVVSLGEPAGERVSVDDADEISCYIEGIGRLTNPVTAQQRD
jgi:2,4-diketo-3-deoxy-L-fuconate hydrolase